MITILYYIIFILLIQLIYIIPYVDQDSYHDIEDNKIIVEHDLETILLILFSFGIKVLFTTFIDNLLLMIKLNVWNPFKINYLLISDILLPLSLIVSSICILFHTEYSIEFLFVMIGYGQVLMLYSLYGKLIQMNSNNQWIKTIYLSFSLLFYLLSEIFLDKAMVNINNNNKWVIGSIIFNSFSFGINIYSSYMYIKTYRQVTTDIQVQNHSKKLNIANEFYTYVLILSLTSIYLFIRLIILIITNDHINQWNNEYDQKFLKFNSILQLLVVLLVSLIPGRVQQVDGVEIKSKLEYKETFIRYLSHEIRSPLSTAILGLHHLLTNMQSSTITYNEAIEIINDAKSSAELASDTMDDLLLYDKINSSKLELHLTFKNHWKFIIDCVKPFKSQAIISKLKLSCKLIDETHNTCVILIDKKQIKQVIKNLVTNAMKFTPSQGSIEVVATILPSFSNNNPMLYNIGDRGVLRISVTDSGTGLTKEKINELFMNDVTLSSKGIGLRLSRSIIEMHNGYIGAISEGINKGSTFFLEIPCFSPKDPEKGSENSDNSSSFHNGSNNNLERSSSIQSKSDHIQQTSLHISDAILKAQLKVLPMLSNKSSKLVQQLNNNQQIKPLIFNITSPELEIVSTRRKSVKTKFDLAVQLRAIVENPQGDVEDDENDEKDNHIQSAINTASLSTSSFSIGGAAGQGVGSSDIIDTSIISYDNDSKQLHYKKKTLHIDTNLDDLSNKDDETGIAKRNSVHFLPEEKSNLYVLLADDAPLTRKMVTRSIASLCRDCDQACHGLEAVTKVADSIDRGDPYDVVIIDFYMPVMNGNEAIKAIRNNGYTSIILAVTGSNSKNDEESLLNAGADAVIVKPLTLEIFKKKIDEVLSNALKSV